MKVLIVASNKSGQYAPFIMDQVKELSMLGVEFAFFPIIGTGIRGYLKSLPELKKVIRLTSPDLIHAHYGLSGLLASLQRKCPTIITFHGSDINVKRNRRLSKMAHLLCTQSIFVSEALKSTLNVKKGEVIPCGIDTDLFADYGIKNSREKLGLDLQKKYILFSSSFNRPVKDYPLAKSAVDKFDDENVELLELKGFTREEIPIIMSAANCGLVTSISESGPLFVKEAIACGLPVVSVDVGEVKKSFKGTQGNCLVSRDKNDIYKAVKSVLDKGVRSVSNGKEQSFSNKEIAKLILIQYEAIQCRN